MEIDDDDFVVDENNNPIYYGEESEEDEDPENIRKIMVTGKEMTKAMKNMLLGQVNNNNNKVSEKIVKQTRSNIANIMNRLDSDDDDEINNKMQIEPEDNCPIPEYQITLEQLRKPKKGKEKKKKKKIQKKTLQVLIMILL